MRKQLCMFKPIPETLGYIFFIVQYVVDLKFNYSLIIPVHEKEQYEFDSHICFPPPPLLR